MPTWKNCVRRKNKAFITGIAGFAGSYLAGNLLEKGFEVFGLLAPEEKTENIATIKKQVHLSRADLMDERRLAKIIRQIKPDYIFHLAAMASVGESFKKSRLTYQVNFFGTLNLLEAAVELKTLEKVILVSSGDIYGRAALETKSLDESRSPEPISPYGVSKFAAEVLGQFYHMHHGLPIVRARAFNHTGPRQSETYVIPSFCRQIALIEAGRQKPEILVGNLSARRDISDVRDIVEGYYLLARKGKPGRIYHLCSGKSLSISDLLNTLRSLSNEKIAVKVDKKRFRKADIPVLRGNNRRAAKELGWHRRYSLEETLKATLDYWRMKIGH